jgi:Ca2+-binding RTX toxin-like protein
MAVVTWAADAPFGFDIFHVIDPTRELAQFQFSPTQISYAYLHDFGIVLGGTGFSRTAFRGGSDWEYNYTGTVTSIEFYGIEGSTTLWTSISGTQLALSAILRGTEDRVGSTITGIHEFLNGLTIDFALVGDDTLHNNSATDQTLRGWVGSDTIIGSAGTDVLDGGPGADLMIGGPGLDFYIVDNIGDTVREDPAGGYDLVFSTIHFRLPANVEDLYLTGSADLQGYGNNLHNLLSGNTGNNLLNGEGGADGMNGGAGNDVYFVDDVGDVVNELPGEGNDTVFSTAHFRLSANVETLILQGSADLQGYGNTSINTIYGGAGNDLLNGDADADLMAGGAGNDAYFVDNFADAVFENPGEGNDTVFSSAHFRLSPNVENLILQGSADLQGYGNNLSNVLYGNVGSNILNGEGGVDAMFGGAGNDAYFVDNTSDAAIENANEGIDTVYATAHYRLGANVENLVLQGSFNLQAYGNDLSNAIFGNAGSNAVNGGAGADMLTGGEGNDAFIFEAGQAAGDTVVDFDGKGTAAGDWLLFVGYGPGATFTNVDPTHWRLSYNGGASQELITFANGASIDPGDFAFL